MAQPIAEYLKAALTVQGERVREAARALGGGGEHAVADSAAGTGALEAAEALHQFRVQLRRLRSALRGTQGVYGRFHVRAIGQRLAALIELTNPTRDAEVLLPRLRTAAAGEAARAALATPLAQWEAQAARSRRKLARELASGTLEEALGWLAALLLLPVRPGRNLPAARVARRAVAAHAEAFVAGVARVPELLHDAAALHALRLEAKRLRYLVDFYEPLLRKRQRKLEPLAREMQGALGELHDLDVLLGRVGRMRTLPDAVRRELLRRVRAERARQGEAVRAAAARAQDAADTLLAG